MALDDIFFGVLTLLIWAWPVLKILLLFAIAPATAIAIAIIFGLGDPPGH